MLQDMINAITATPLRELAPPQHYKPITDGAPHLIVLQLPLMLWRNGFMSNINDRHKVVVAENTSEFEEVMAALDQPLQVLTRGDQTVVNFKATIDKVSARPSKRPVWDFMILHYAPPEPGWPHVVLTTASMNIPGQGFSRERYAHDLFADGDAAFAHILDLSRFVGLAGGELDIRVVS